MVINYSLLLPNKQFLDATGPEDRVRQQFSKQNWEFFQILQDVNHCFFVARVEEGTEEEFYLYDSLSSSYTSKNVVKQICQIKFFKGKQLRLCKRSVQ